MSCPNCHADIEQSLRTGEILPRCPKCGSHVLPMEAEAELEGFRARLAQFGLGGERLTRPLGGAAESA
ncbi:MAG: hypothetical protein MUC69_12035 [Gemmatimonadales bacterium]|jgi:DNA-directed RNA polymerase subunit RPC12/RpoP|nr:hypothetical protein [Gemmatimonadales bacterium]